MYRYKFPANNGKITIEITSEVFKKAKVIQWISHIDYVEVATKDELPEEYNEYRI